MNTEQSLHTSCWIGLLRGINVSGHNMIKMPELVEVCRSLGWQDVRSYIQSGNLVFQAAGAPAELEQALEQAITTRWGYSIPVIVRSAAQWASYVASNPFPAESNALPNFVMLGLSRQPLRADAAVAIQARAAANERIVQVDDALWFFYADGAGRSKLTPALLDRSAGSPVTARNWRTVLALQELVAGV